MPRLSAAGILRLQAGEDVNAADVTVRGVAWALDGRSLYFRGYLDRRAIEENPFPVYRIGRHGRDLRELLRGERVSVGCCGTRNTEGVK